MWRSWATMALLLAVVRPAAAGTVEDWLAWQVEQERWLLASSGLALEELDPVQWSDAAMSEGRPPVVRVGTAPAPPRVALRAGLGGGPRPQAAVGVLVTMEARAVYRTLPTAPAPAPPAWEPPAGEGGGEGDQVLRALLAGEPSIEEVQAAAVRHAGCGEEVIRALQRDAQAFGALPEVTLQGQLDGGWDRDLDAFGNTTASGDDRAWDVSLQVEWDLADLAMSYERIRVEAERQDLVHQRTALLEAVTAAYFERQRLRLRLRADPPPAAEDRLELQLQLRQVTAGLDAMTGGELAWTGGDGE